MDPTNLVPQLVSVLTTALIAALKDRSVRTFENKTKRVQFWKTMLDAAPLADVTNVAFMKEQCKHEMAEAVDTVAVESNKFVGEISTLMVLGLEIVVVCTLARISTEALSMLQQQGIPPQEAEGFAIGSAIVQAATFAYVWFWGRGRIRLWIWNEIKPGAPFEALRQNRRLQGAVGLLTIFILMGIIWLSPRIMFPPR